MSRLCTRLALLLLACSALPAHAGSALFGTTNVQYLYGTRYADFSTRKPGDFQESDEASVITIEHFDVWKYGDNFFFVDITNAEREGDDFATPFIGAPRGFGAYYGELSPRLSFPKMLGSKLELGPIVDLLLSFNLEIPSEGVEQTFLYGLAADFKVPGFQFVQLNFYERNAQSAALETGFQVTVVWGAPFKIGPVDFRFEGFFDYAWGEDPKTPGGRYQDNIITAPRFLIDAGGLFGSPGVVQAGVEYQIWKNKFGIDGMDEDVPQAMVKWILQ